jgi:hypothetical protein
MSPLAFQAMAQLVTCDPIPMAPAIDRAWPMSQTFRAVYDKSPGILSVTPPSSAELRRILLTVRAWSAKCGLKIATYFANT